MGADTTRSRSVELLGVGEIYWASVMTPVLGDLPHRNSKPTFTVSEAMTERSMLILSGFTS